MPNKRKECPIPVTFDLDHDDIDVAADLFFRCATTDRGIHHDFPEGCAAVAATVYVLLSIEVPVVMKCAESLTGHTVAVQPSSALTSSMAKFASPAAIATGRYMQLRLVFFPEYLVLPIALYHLVLACHRRHARDSTLSPTTHLVCSQRETAYLIPIQADFFDHEHHRPDQDPCPAASQPPGFPAPVHLPPPDYLVPECSAPDYGFSCVGWPVRLRDCLRRGAFVRLAP